MDALRSVLRLSVVLVAAALLLGRPGPAATQDRGSLVGTVVDETSGEVLEGATVSVLDADLEAETDEEGEFLLPDVPAGELTLRIEQPGYSSVVEQVEVNATDITYFRVRLPRLEAMLREIRVIAGAPRSSGNSETEVRRSDDDYSTTAADLLAERVPGVEITWGNGTVGAGAAVRLRGVSSISLSNSPAVYLDGVRLDEGAKQAPGARGMTTLHVLQTIPAEQVERIRVLRGPSAAAQYADAANGVILIETRRGDGDSGGGGNGGDDEG